jgi:bacillithiol system protein YtxJ
VRSWVLDWSIVDASSFKERHLGYIQSMKMILNEADVDKAWAASETGPILIYKHSPICGLSDTAILEWEQFMAIEPGRYQYYQVDVLEARGASKKIESLTQVRHESPQILLISKSACTWHASHRKINLAYLTLKRVPPE